MKHFSMVLNLLLINATQQITAPEIFKTGTIKLETSLIFPANFLFMFLS